MNYSICFQLIIWKHRGLLLVEGSVVIFCVLVQGVHLLKKVVFFVVFPYFVMLVLDLQINCTNSKIQHHLNSCALGGNIGVISFVSDLLQFLVFK